MTSVEASFIKPVCRDPGSWITVPQRILLQVGLMIAILQRGGYLGLEARLLMGGCLPSHAYVAYCRYAPCINLILLL